MQLNRKLPMVDATRFSMVPRSDVPRSTFQTQHTLKTTFDVDYLVPIYVDEVLPGDVHSGDVTFFARLATPLFPIMDNICIETFFFFVPNRIIWANWKKFMGEQTHPSDSIDYTVPYIQSEVAGFPIMSVFDYMGCPTSGQVSITDWVRVNALPLRAYNSIFNEWFRDENLVSNVASPTTDGPDAHTLYTLKKRAKKHDYFTSCLPWPVKGGIEVPLPIGTSAPVVSDGGNVLWGQNLTPGLEGVLTVDAASANRMLFGVTAGGPPLQGGAINILDAHLEADLSQAVGATLNSMRLAITTQQLLERDARGGTRYTELLRSHFGVVPEDSRLQRPEYIGGGKSYVKTQAIPQTSASAYGGTASTPMGSLAGTITASDGHPFRYMAKEHGYIIGLVNVSGDVTYQQGLHKLWSRSTRYDFYGPAFATLGEQAVLKKEIYVNGDIAGNDDVVFGYQERWAEYRHRPSRITGLFRSTSTGNIDEWHLAEQFAGPGPALNETFITQKTPIDRVLAAGATAAGVQILWDSVFNVRSTRALPTHSVPGLTRF